MAKKKTIVTLAQDLKAIQQDIANTQHLKNAAVFIRDRAADLAPDGDGALSQSIRYSIDGSDEQIVIHVGTSLAYALYVEFGTGPKGQKNHQGVSPDVPVTYQAEPWWIHESQVPPGTAERYHWFSIQTKEGKFYRVSGQAAQPYLYPAIKNNEKYISSLIVDGWKTAIRRHT